MSTFKLAPFDHKKATQALNFLALMQDGSINKMKAIKLVYFVDRYHLRKYGRLVTNDTYYAMEHGPVGSGVKDIAESSLVLDQHEEQYASRFISPTDKHMFKSVAPVDYNVFSDSDVEALTFAWDVFGGCDQFQLRDITHLYPDWKKHEQTLSRSSRANMDIEDFLDDPTENVDKCFELDEEDKRDRQEQLQEAAAIEALWG